MLIVQRGRYPRGLAGLTKHEPPLLESLNQRNHRSTQHRQRILDLRRHNSVHHTCHKSVGFELPKLLRQHLVGNGWQLPFQLAIAKRPVFEAPNDRELPLASEDVERQLHGVLVGDAAKFKLWHDGRTVRIRALPYIFPSGSI